jgi:ParB family chromosome partitioning protein
VVHHVPVDAIAPCPRNPRQRLGSIDELADSLRAHGLLQPVVVRRRGAGYELVAGHRRLEAAKQLSWAEIAAVVRDETDDQAYILTLVENLQREDLSPKEEAEALEVLVRERGWSTRQVGQAIKRGPMYVSRRLRVFEDDTLAPLVLADQLPVSTAEELLVISDAEHRSRLARQAADEGWERPRVRAAVRECIAAIQPPTAAHRSAQVLKLVGQLRAVLDAGPVSHLSEEARSAVAVLANQMLQEGAVDVDESTRSSPSCSGRLDDSPIHA